MTFEDALRLIRVNEKLRHPGMPPEHYWSLDAMGRLVYYAGEYGVRGCGLYPDEIIRNDWGVL